MAEGAQQQPRAGASLEAVQRGLWAAQAREVIVEVVKERVMQRCRDGLAIAVENELDELEGSEGTEEEKER